MPNRYRPVRPADDRQNQRATHLRREFHRLIQERKINPLRGWQVDRESIQYLGHDLQRPECILAERDGTIWTAQLNTKATDGYIAVLDDTGVRMVADGFCGTNEIRFDPNAEWLYAHFHRCTYYPYTRWRGADIAGRQPSRYEKITTRPLCHRDADPADYGCDPGNHCSLDDQPDLRRAGLADGLSRQSTRNYSAVFLESGGRATHDSLAMSNLFDLTGKVALVTGSSSGMGRAIAEATGQHGAIIIVSSNDADGCASVMDEFKK